MSSVWEKFFHKKVLLKDTRKRTQEKCFQCGKIFSQEGFLERQRFYQILSLVLANNTALHLKSGRDDGPDNIFLVDN